MNIKFPYSKKFLKATLALALVAAPATTLIQPGQASATTLVQPTTNFTGTQPILDSTNGSAPAKQVTDAKSTGSVKVEVYNDDKTASNEVLHVTVRDKSGTLVSSGDTASGSFTTTEKNLTKGTYYVTITDEHQAAVQNGDRQAVYQTTEVKVSSKEAKVKLTWESTYADLNKDSKGAIKKSGAIAGVVYAGTSDSADIADPDTLVTLVSKKTQWTTKTNDKGAFKVYVPSGTYNVIVNGSKNTIYKGVKVTAGQTALPLEQLNNAGKYASGEDKLNFSLKTSATDIKLPTTTKLVGTANANAVVTVYTVEASGDTVDVNGKVTSADTYTYTWAGEAVANKKTGEFKIGVKKNALAGKTIKFVVTDEAGNVYDDSALYTVDQIPAPKLTISAAKGTTGDSTKITVSKTKTTSPRLLIKVASSAASTPLIGSVATGDTVSVGSLSVDNIAITADQFVNVYEVDADNKVLSFNSLKIAATKINK